MATTDRPGRLFLLSLSLISAAALSYEILLMRLLSIVQWHHFAYMIISLALLGYGASGTFLTLAARWLADRLATAYFINAAGFAFTSLGCFVLAQRQPFNPFEMLWDTTQWLHLLAIYLLLAVPFFCAANCVGLSFRRFDRQVHRVYAADLIGAGTGAVGIVFVLSTLSPEQSLRLIVVLGSIAAGLSAFTASAHVSRWAAAGVVILACALAFGAPASWTRLHLSPYKGLSQAQAVLGTRVLSEHNGPMGRLSVAANDSIPFRIAPGISLSSRSEIPPQLAVFGDGDGASAINRFDGDMADAAYLAELSSALPYYLSERPRVLVVGAGGGSDVLQALYFNARHIDAVEINPQMAELMQRDYADYSGGLFRRDDVTLHIDDARHYIAGTTQRYDLMQLALVDSFAASSAGVQALNETYLYTVEALREYLVHLTPQGMVAITRWMTLPPRDSLKLFATALDALAQSGVAEPAQHLALVRSWKTVTLLISKTPLSAERIAKLREFCRARSFDVAYFPGIVENEVNTYNVLDAPHYYQGAMALISEHRAQFIDRYKFNITPPTDDKPYFFHFFKWSALQDLLTLRQQGGLPMLEWGYLIVLATLTQAVAASVLLILLPLWSLRGAASSRGQRPRVAIYFAALGLAYLFIEIAFIQKFVLFLGHPVYSVAATICAFLIFSGLGSAASAGFSALVSAKGRDPIRTACIAVAAVLSIYVAALSPILNLLLWLPDAVKFVAALALIAPLAFCMGMPFPLGLGRVTVHAPQLMPWAWGINGCASVISAVLAVLLAVHLGFTAVGIIAGLLYLLAGFSWGSGLRLTN